MITNAVHQPGKLAIFVGGNRWHGHDLREVGYRSYVREADRGFTVLDTLVYLETRQVTYEATLDLLNRHPDLKGIYVAGGGMEGAITALIDLMVKSSSQDDDGVSAQYFLKPRIIVPDLL